MTLPLTWVEIIAPTTPVETIQLHNMPRTKIVNQPAMAKYRPEEFKPGVQYQSHEDLARLAGDIASTIFHPVGTTKMGRDDDPMAVVDSHLRVRGIAGLRVVDAGVMPTVTSGNTNSPTLMIAEKAARWIVAGA